eukprot:5542986-Amphidinium_carterae.1
MKSAQEREKIGIIKLADMAEPRLLRSIGRPAPLHHHPQLVDNPYAMPRPCTCFERSLDPPSWSIASAGKLSILTPCQITDQLGMRGPGFRAPFLSRMSPSQSDPNLWQSADWPQDQMSLSWQREEAAEISQIAKPGGPALCDCCNGGSKRWPRAVSISR